MRPRKWRAISVHFLGPYRATSSITLSSSSLVHGPLINSGFTTLVHRCWHWMSVRSFKHFAMLSHRSPYWSTSNCRAASSCFVHLVLFWDLFRPNTSSSDISDKSSSPPDSSSSIGYLNDVIGERKSYHSNSFRRSNRFIAQKKNRKTNIWDFRQTKEFFGKIEDIPSKNHIQLRWMWCNSQFYAICAVCVCCDI